MSIELIDSFSHRKKVFWEGFFDEIGNIETREGKVSAVPKRARNSSRLITQ